MHGAMSYYRLGRTHSRRQLREQYVPPPRHFLPVMLRIGIVESPTFGCAPALSSFQPSAQRVSAFQSGAFAVSSFQAGAVKQDARCACD
jgi:hypothetical protein